MAHLSNPDHYEKIAREVAAVINRNSLENGSNTPDFLLAEYLLGCLVAYDRAVLAREKWYGREPKPALIQLPHATIASAEMIEEVVKRNGGVECDMKQGPCACGAWHDEPRTQPLEQLAPNAIIYRQDEQRA